MDKKHDEEKHDDVPETNSGKAQGLDRRNALLKIVRTAAYAVPTATVLLAASKDAKAGVALSGMGGNGGNGNNGNNNA